VGEIEYPHVELIVTNYTRLSEESQYRDDLLIRANYFSLAVIAVLIGTLLQASPVVRPLVAMAGVAIAYSFWLATESYKGARRTERQHAAYRNAVRGAVRGRRLRHAVSVTDREAGASLRTLSVSR